MKKQWYLGLDYGQAWIGAAVGNQDSGALSLKAVANRGREYCVKEIAKIVDEYEVSHIVIGLPEGRLVDEIKAWGRELEKVTGLEVVYQDERSSSREADSLARADNLSLRKVKHAQHSWAAGEILRRYLSRNDVN